MEVGLCNKYQFSIENDNRLKHTLELTEREFHW